MYVNVPGLGRRKSKKRKAFQLEMHNYWRANATTIAQARELLRGSGGCAVHITLHFRKERILTKTGGVKKLDTANFLKAIHDGLADLLGIDDRYFWRVSAEKVVGHADYCTAEVTPWDGVEVMRRLHQQPGSAKGE